MNNKKSVFSEKISLLKKLHPETEEKLLALWACELDIAERILDVCEKYGLKIWAEGGTMLGAVRHKGFIPWDDDMDFFMLRPDYDKLVDVSAQEFKAPYFFQCADTEKGYFRGHAQVRNSETAAIIPFDIWQPFNQGAFVDIFVFDAVPEDETQRERLYKEIQERQKKLFSYSYGRGLFRPLKALLAERRLSFRPMFGYFKKMERLVSENPIHQDSLVSYPLFSVKLAPRYTRRVASLEKTLYLGFEYLKIPVPEEYDLFLRNIYGDYMTPVEQPSCHGGLVIDLTTGYKKIVSSLRSEAGWIERLKHLRF